MRNILERLERSVTVLWELQQKRIETGDPQLGYDVEQSIIDTELRDLERGMVCDPGIPREELVYVRRLAKS